MGNTFRPEITDAEVLAVTSGLDMATGQPVVCLTLRPITGAGWAPINYSLAVDDARSLFARLAWVFETSPSITGGRAEGICPAGGSTGP